MTEVRGQQYQHATVKPVATATGSTFSFKTHKKVSYKSKVPKKATTDAEGNIDGYTFDKKETEASITVKLSEYHSFRQWLLDQGGGLGVLQVVFDLPVSYGNQINALKTDSLRNCMLQEEPRGSEDNQDALEVELPLFVQKIDYADGPDMVYDSDQA